MSDNNWDLGAVVRSYSTNRPNNFVVLSLGLESLTFENDVDWIFFFYSLLDDDHDNLPFKGLAEFISWDFSVAYQQKPDDQSSSIINPTIPFPIQLAQLSQPIFLFSTPSPAPAPCVPVAALPCVPSLAPYQSINPQQEVVMQAKVHHPFMLPSRTILIQTCRRKNQAEKIFIYELRQEELTDDTWAWRKYGQRSMKTSPFLRNYYMCISKGCRAKKHIEKSPNAKSLFIVAYFGEHNHPPPTTKRSCTHDAKSKLPKGINIVPRPLRFNSSSSNCSRRCSSVSQLIPNTPTLEMESAPIDTKELVAVEKKRDEEAKVVLIPNKFASEDILKSFEELKEITCNKCGSST